MDAQDFQRFYSDTRVSLWAFVLRTTMDRFQAEEVLQESYYRLIRQIAAGAKIEEPRRYLYRIASNLCVSGFRERGRIDPIDEDEAAPESDREALEALRAALPAITAKERALLWLAHGEGRSHAEIAAILEVKEGSVRVLLHRAREKLRAALSPQAGAEVGAGTGNHESTREAQAPVEPAQPVLE